MMNNDDAEGTLFLEKLASLGLVDEFFEAVDADDFGKIASLLRDADIDEDTIQDLIKMIEEG